MTARESHLVELVDAEGAPTGSVTVAEAHRAPGRLHRAFSVFLRDPSGRVLLQQRASHKTRFPLRWANTCCGHPMPGEEVTVAAVRRLGEELGIGPVALTDVGVHSYYAEDPATGRVEYEYDHVLLGDLPEHVQPRPDPAEVAALRWVAVAELLTDVRRDPVAYAPWLTGVADRLAKHLGSVTAARAPEPGGRLPESGEALRPTPHPAARPTPHPAARQALDQAPQPAAHPVPLQTPPAATHLVADQAPQPATHLVAVQAPQPATHLVADGSLDRADPGTFVRPEPRATPYADSSPGGDQGRMTRLDEVGERSGNGFG